MAVRSPSATARFYSALTDTTAASTYDGSRIVSASWTDEAPTFSKSRRLGDVTVRLSNDFGTNSDGWTGPAMSAVKAEDPEELVGTYLWLAIGDPAITGLPRALVDQVQCDDSSVTVHGTFHDVLLDRTLDEAGVSGEIASGQDMQAWWVAAAEACGESFNSSYYPPSLSAPSALSIDGSTTVRQAMEMTLAYTSRTVAPHVTTVLARPYSYSSSTRWEGAYTWPEPANTERYGLLVVNDPSDGSSQEVTLDSTQPGTLEVDVAWSSTGTPSMSLMADWARRRHADQQYTVELPGIPSLVVSHSIRTIYCASYTDGNGDTRYQTMNANRVEGRFDGGLSVTVTGTLGDVV